MPDKSFYEVESEIWRSLSQMIDNTWWVEGSPYSDYVIVYYNGSYYKVPYSYGMDDDGDSDSVIIPPVDQWEKAEIEWVAKQMHNKFDSNVTAVPVQEETDISKNDVKDDNGNSEDNTDIVEFDVAILSKSQKKQITYSIVYEPNIVDSQSDWADAEEIEKMAHNYLKNHLINIRPAADLEHKVELDLEKAIPVESYIAPQDFTINEQLIKKGSWVLAMYIPDEQIWERVEKGEITGYSLRGKGLRIPAELQ